VARQCRFGITYARVDDQRFVTGVIASDLTDPSSRTRRRFRAEPDRRVRSGDIRAAVLTAVNLGAGVVDDFHRSKEEVLARLERDPDMHRALAEELRKGFQTNLDQSHDFLQLVKLVRGHAEVLLSEKYPDLSPDDAAERLPTEGAIYFSTQLMLVKMDALVFLQEINRALGSESRFQIHPFVVKYARIYKWQAEQKDLSIRLEGACYAWSRYNSPAIGALIQGLLDNLVKYAPAGSKAAVVFDEQDDYVDLTFSSLGPRIEPEERAQIFLPGFRGRAARQFELTGLGVGLATAKQVSDALSLDLDVHQEDVEDPTHRSRFRTSFSVRLQRVA
jgi:signal transduction histidine kinase